MIGTIILDITYGYETKPKDDEWVALADRVVNDFADAVKCVYSHSISSYVDPTYRPGAWLVDVIPAC